MNRHLQVSSFCGGLAISIAMLGFNNPANALNFQTFTNRATWLNQLTGGLPSVSENFNSYRLDRNFGTTFKTTPSGITIVGGGGISNNEALLDPPPYFGAPTNDPPTGIDDTIANGRGVDEGEFFTVGLPSQLSAFGFDYENYDVNKDAFGIFINSQNVISIPASTGAKGFIGIIADGTFNNVVFNVSHASGGGVFNGIDNLAAGTANFPTAAVPFEFSPSLGLLAVGSIWGVSRWRKQLTARKIVETITT